MIPIDINQLLCDYEEDLQRVEHKIRKLFLQESACHAAGDHQAAWKLAQERVSYMRVRRDLLYAMGEMTRGRGGDP